jgi:hypothetical protein
MLRFDEKNCIKKNGGWFIFYFSLQCFLAFKFEEVEQMPLFGSDKSQLHCVKFRV